MNKVQRDGKVQTLVGRPRTYSAATKRISFAAVSVMLFAAGGFFAFADTKIVVAGDILINEFDPNGNPDWVELLNITEYNIPLTNWKIQDLTFSGNSITGTATTTIGAIVIPAHGIVTVNITTAGLNADHDALTLFDNYDLEISAVQYGINPPLSGVTESPVPNAGQTALWGGSSWIAGSPTKGWFNGAPTIAGIVSSLSASGVTTNLGTAGIADPSSASGLYFEKTGQGRVTFSAALNLTSTSTKTFLQNLGTYLTASPGVIKFDARTASALQTAGAEIKMYGLDALGFTATPSIIVKDDDGNTIDGSGIVSGASFAAGTLTFNASHFTEFDVPYPLFVNAATGNDANDGRTPATAKQTIGGAISAALSGAVVNIAAGTYAESVIVNKPLTLNGAASTTTIIQPAIDQDGVKIATSTVTVKNLKIITSNSGAAPNIAVRIENADNVEVSDDIIETTGNKAMGIWVCGSTSGCTAADNLIIKRNTITIGGSATGIYAEEANPAHSGWTIGGSAADGNTITANFGNPLELYDVSASEVSRNTFNANGATCNCSAVIWSSELANLSNLTFSNNAVNGSSGSEVAILTDFPTNVAPDTSVTTLTISGNTFGNWGSRALKVGTANGTGTVSGITLNSNTFNMTADTEVIGGTAAAGATGSGNTFNVSGAAKIQKAIDAAKTSDLINVSAGTYAEDLSIPAAKTGLNISGTGSPTIKAVARHAVPGPTAAPNIDVLASGVKIHGFTIEGPDYLAGNYASGMIIGAPNMEVYSNIFRVTPAAVGDEVSQAIQTWHKDNLPAVDLSGLNIHDNTFTSLSAGAAGYEGIWLNLDTGTGTSTIQNNTFTGNIFRAITTERSKTAISGNTITNDLPPSNADYSSGVGGWQGINVGGANNGAVSDVYASGNTIQGATTGKGFSYGIKLGFDSASSFSTTSLSGNTIHNSGTAGIWTKITANGISANYNDLSGNTLSVKNDDAVNSLNTANNWWGAADPDFPALISGLVAHSPWWTTPTDTPSAIPSAPVVSAITTPTNNSAPTVGWSAVSAPPPVKTYGVSLDGSLLTIVSAPTVGYQLPPLADGPHSVRVAAVNSMGTSTDSNLVSFTVDTAPPVVSSAALSPDGLKKIGDAITLTITADAAGYSGGTISVNGKPITAFTDQGGGTYSATYTIASGDTSRATSTTPISVVFIDSALNQNLPFTAVSVNGIAIDAKAPTTTVAALQTKDNTPTVSGSVSETASGISVSVGAHTYTATLAGLNWQADVSDILPDGLYNVTATATDIAGNTGGDATANELLIDTAPPSVAPPATQTFEAAAATTSPALAPATGSDGGSGLLSITPSQTGFGLGTTTVVWTATDNVGNSASTTSDVIIKDTTAPVISGYGGINEVATDASGKAIAFSPTATDLVDGAVAVSCLPASGSVFAIGTTTVNCSAADSRGNESAASFLVTIADKVVAAPQVTLNAGATQVVFSTTTTATSTISVPSEVTNPTIDLSDLVTAGAATSSVVLPATIAVNATTSAGTISFQLPAALEITAATTTWSGIMNLPQVKNSSTVSVTPDEGNTATVASVIEIGFGDVKLVFNKAVRLLLSGQGDRDVGYSRGGVFTKITALCGADSQTAGDALPDEGECKIIVGADLVVWTKHFTSFVTYTQSPIPPPPAPAVGGGGLIIQPATSAAAKTDINRDGATDLLDFNLLMVNWSEEIRSAPAGAGGAKILGVADLNGDGKTDAADFNLLMVHWSK